MNVRAQPIIEDRLARPLSVSDVRTMIAAGVLAPDERVELVDGVLIQMAAKNRTHELVKNWLMLQAADNRGDGYTFSVEGTVYLDDNAFVEPDIAFHRPGTVITDLDGPDLLLVIEVADTSLRYDLGRKADLYAEQGVPELWVIDAHRRVTFVHRQATANGYAVLDERAGEDTLRPIAVPGFTMRLADAG